MNPCGRVSYQVSLEIFFMMKSEFMIKSDSSFSEHTETYNKEFQFSVLRTLIRMEEIPRTVNVRFEDKYLQIKSSVRIQTYSLFSELRDTIIEKLKRANEDIGMGKHCLLSGIKP